ncbi:type III endosome membrane protein TEMP [Hyperolius riggenbachi]|uniref:type III endosome membrane protein TEMP n=1 Tax=Hyperolius riggenbachi TaxID=752182 RepID=UPI0035A2F5F6
MRHLMYVALLLPAISAHPCTVTSKVSVDCSNKGLINIPRSLPWNLQHLDLSANSLHLSQPLSERLSRLRYLNLSRNPLHILPAGAFQNLPHLQILDLSDCGISRFNASILDGLTKLQFLFLSHNKLRTFDVHSLKELLKLDLTNTLVTSSHLGRSAKQVLLQLDSQGFCDCSSRRRLKESTEHVSGSFCSCKMLKEKRRHPVQKTRNSHAEVIKRFVRDVPDNTTSLNDTSISTIPPPTSSLGSWPYFVGFVLAAVAVSLLIAAVAKCNLLHRYFRSYRHRPLPENEWAAESQSELPGVPITPPDDEDGFIEDNYIQPEDHRKEEDEEEEEEMHGEFFTID